MFTGLLHLLRLLTPSALALPLYDIYCGALGTYCGSGQDFLIDIGAQIIVVLSEFVGGMAVLAAAWGGVKVLSSAGNDTGKEEGKKIIIYAIIGMVLSLMVYSVVAFFCNVINNALGGSVNCAV